MNKKRGPSPASVPQAQGQDSRKDKKFSDLSASNLALALPVSVSESFRVCAQNEQAWREVA